MSLLARCCSRCPRSSTFCPAQQNEPQVSPVTVGLRYVSSERRRSSSPHTSLHRRSAPAASQTALALGQPFYCTSYMPVGPSTKDSSCNSYARLSVGRNVSTPRRYGLGRGGDVRVADVAAGGAGTKLEVKPPQLRHQSLTVSESSRQLMSSDSGGEQVNYSRLSGGIEAELVPI